MEELVGLMDRPVVSMCVLRWIRDLVEDSAFTATAGFVALSPALLQLVATAQELYPLQRPDCFDILKVSVASKYQLHPYPIRTRIRFASASQLLLLLPTFLGELQVCLASFRL